MKQLFILFVILLASLSFSYYADVVFDVQDNGDVLVSGFSDNLDLNEGLHQELTSKDKEFWVFDLNLNENFSSFAYEINLPDNTKLNYLNLTGFSNISTSTDKITITGFGENKPLSLKVQYSFGDKEMSLDWLWLILAVTIIGIFMFVFEKLKKRKTKPKKDYKHLTERELSIIKFLEKNNYSTQNKIEKALGIPKSSLSRNLLSLEKKGIIKKQQKGLSNLIYIE